MSNWFFLLFFTEHDTDEIWSISGISPITLREHLVVLKRNRNRDDNKYIMMGQHMSVLALSG